MKNKSGLNIGFFFLLIGIGAYKHFVTEEPWAIGLSQVFMLVIILATLYAGIVNWPSVKSSVREYFLETASPVNIAFFRIVFFSYMFFVTNTKEVLWYSQFPKSLQLAPLGMNMILPYIPIDLPTASIMVLLFKVACVFSIIGLFCRFSTITAAITGFYVLGVPEFYGSVSHYHHLFWFLAIFAASRCGDALSADAVIGNIKKADRKQPTVIPEASRTYALPLRFIWLLMGICYFFPGFWKLWNSGTSWLLGDNMRNHMWLDWASFDYWIPVLRIDQWPWACRLAGAFAIIFEITFPFLIFVKRLRLVPAFGGLFFHNMTFLMMKIDFYDLQICYTSFFNWKKIFDWLGKKLYPVEMTVLFDGSCSFCRRALGFLHPFDVMGRIQYLDLNDPVSEYVRNKIKVPHETLMTDMHGVIGTKVVKGFEAYRHIAARIPLLWVLYPFLFLGFVQSIGNRIYRQVADHRACRIPPKVNPSASPEPTNAVLIAVASILILGNVVMGFRGIGSGWPFACYPTFSEIAWDRLRTISCEIVYLDNREETLRFEFVKNYTGLYKVVGMVGKIYSTKDESLKKKKFEALWEVFVRSNPDLKGIKQVRFYFLENYTDPAKWHLNPAAKILATQIDVENPS